MVDDGGPYDNPNTNFTRHSTWRSNVVGAARVGGNGVLSRTRCVINGQATYDHAPPPHTPSLSKKWLKFQFRVGDLE